MSESDAPKPKFSKLMKAMARPKAKKEPEPEPCCDGMVHIAYRGISDDRMYVIKDRQHSEIKYFRANGLRAFCAKCRKRLPLPTLLQGGESGGGK